MSTNFQRSDFEMVPQQPNNSFDWSQFEEVKGTKQPVFKTKAQDQKSAFDWDQFEQVKEPLAPDNRSDVEKVVDKTARLGTMFVKGGIQRATAGYDIPAILARKWGIKNAPQEFRKAIFSDLENLQEQKAAGQWSEEDQIKYDGLVELIKHPEKMEEFLPKEEDIPHFDVGSMIDAGAKQLGVDLTPQGLDEVALQWMGFIKDPKKAAGLMKNGWNPQNVKEVIKALTPTGKEAVRGLSAGTALQYAAENEFGPMGTMAAVVLADIAPALAVKTAVGAGQFAKHPVESTKNAINSAKLTGKQLIAKGSATFQTRDKAALQKAIIQDMREAGVQADFGTITGNNMVKWVQSTLAQSGLTGTALEDFKKSLTQNIVSEYKKLSGELGEVVHSSKYEAGEALKTGLKEARDVDASVYRDLYKSATERAGESQVYAGNVSSLINEIEETMKPGTFKSGEQKSVLDVLNQVKRDVSTSEGGIKSAGVKGLINTKIALKDVIDYEVQGGAKQLLKRVAKEIDDAILTHGKADPQFAKDWAMANKKFGEHAKVFRGKAIDQALKTQDPSQIFNKMNTPHGIAEIKKALSVTPEGRQLYKQLASYKMEELIGQNMVNSTTEQLNFGTFAKLLEKGQNRQIVKSLLGEEGLSRLEKLSKASGRLAETAQKFLNTSRSGIQVADTAIIAKAVYAIGSALTGNPWPLMSTIGLYAGSKMAASLMADPEFLKLVEEAILESKQGNSVAFKNAGTRLAKRIVELQEPATGAIQIPQKVKEKR